MLEKQCNLITKQANVAMEIRTLVLLNSNSFHFSDRMYTRIKVNEMFTSTKVND